jgi:tRNA/tmRNA/rRNA uracil-C5-methylase (TrmA/RlmC/RlmD family)
MAYEAQLELKRKHVADIFARIGGWTPEWLRRQSPALNPTATGTGL